MFGCFQSPRFHRLKLGSITLATWRGGRACLGADWVWRKPCRQIRRHQTPRFEGYDHAQYLGIRMCDDVFVCVLLYAYFFSYVFMCLFIQSVSWLVGQSLIHLFCFAHLIVLHVGSYVSSKRQSPPFFIFVVFCEYGRYVQDRRHVFLQERR